MDEWDAFSSPVDTAPTATADWDAFSSPVPKAQPIGKATIYGYQGDAYGDSASLGTGRYKVPTGAWDNPLTETSIALSPDMERAVTQQGVKPRQPVIVQYADGTSELRTWDDRTMQDAQARQKFGKPLTGRIDLYSPTGKNPRDGKPVVAIRAPSWDDFSSPVATRTVADPGTNLAAPPAVKEASPAPATEPVTGNASASAEATLPPKPTAPTGGLLEQAGAELRKGTYNTAAGVADIIGTVATSPGRKAFDPNNQAELDAVWQQYEKSLPKYNAGGPVYDGGEAKRAALLKRANELSNNPGYFNAGQTLRDEASKAYDDFNTNPAAQNPSAQVGRGVGKALGMLPGLSTGMVGASAQMGTNAYQETYQVAREQGNSDEEAQKLARNAAASTVPETLVYLGAGKLAGMGAAAAVGKEASPLVKGVVSGVTATGANMTAGGLIRAYEKDDLSAMLPTLESATVDTLLGAYHGAETGLQGAKAAQAKRDIAAELERRRVPISLLSEAPRTAQEEYGRATDPYDAFSNALPEPGKDVQPVPSSPQAQPDSQSASNRAYDIDPENIGAREWIIRRVAEGVSREQALQEYSEGLKKGNAWGDTLPAGTRIRTKDGQEFTKDSDGNYFADDGTVFSGNLRGSEVVSSRAKPSTANEQPQPQQVPPPPEEPAPAPQPASAKVEAPLPRVDPQPSAEAGAPVQPVEFPQRQPSIRNAETDRARQAEGMEARQVPTLKSNATTEEQANAILKADPGYADRLVTGLETGQRQARDYDQFVLAKHLENARSAVAKEEEAVVSALDKGDMQERDAAQARVQELRDKAQRIYDVAATYAGTEVARSLQARGAGSASDFSEQGIVRQMRSARGGRQLTPEEQTQAVDLAKKLKDAEQRAAPDANGHAERTFAEDVAEVTKPAKPQPVKRTPEVLDRLKNAAEEARRRIDARRSSGGAVSSGGLQGLPNLPDYAIIGAHHLARGIKIGADFARKMVDEFGDAIRPHIKAIQEAAVAHLRGSARSPDELRGKLAARVAEGATIGDLGGYMKAIAKAEIAGGVRTLPDLVSRLHGHAKAAGLDITPEEARDAYSDYGKLRMPAQDEVSKTQRELRAQAQKTAALEDVLRGVAAKKSGSGRDKQSDVVRRLDKQVKDAMKAAGIEPTDPQTQLASRTKAMETRYANELKDLTEEFDLGRKVGNTREPVTSERIEQLKGMIARVRESLKAVRQIKEMSEDQRADAALRLIQKEESELSRRMEADDFGPKTQRAPVTRPDVVAARARLNALRAEARELRSIQDDYIAAQETKREAQLTSEIEQLKGKVTRGEFAAEDRPKTLESPKIEDLKKERNALNRFIASERGKLAEPKRVEAAKERLREIEDQINNGVLRKPLKSKYEVSQARQEVLNQIKQRHKELNELRRQASYRVGHPEYERYVAQATAAIQRKNADLQQRIADGDFRPTPPRAERPEDQRIIAARAEADRLKEDFLRGQFEASLANRPLPKKAFDLVHNSLSLARAGMTGLDLSAVLRQGGMLSLSHPVKAGQAFVPMLKAFVSSKNADLSGAELKLRENYQNGLYKRAGLELTESDGVSLQKMEEAYQSRWLHMLPKWTGAGLLRGSERAYVTFLNKMRADVFDTLARTLSRSERITDDEAKVIANYINVATGRGALTPKMKQAMVGMNQVFFAPRLVTSRFQALLGQPLWTSRGGYAGTKTARALVATEYARYLIALGAIYSAARFGVTNPIVNDPKSLKFGRLQFQKSFIDPLSGFLQPLVFSWRELTGKKTSWIGRETAIRGDKVPYGGGNGYDLAANFLRTKLSPVAGAVVNIASGKDLGGKPTSFATEAAHLALPLSVKDVTEAIQANGLPLGTAIGLASVLGAGVQTDEPKK